MRDKRLDNRPTAAHEQKLINIGHHLWRKRKQWPTPAITWAIQAVWDAKEEVRRPLREAWLKTLETRRKNLHAKS